MTDEEAHATLKQGQGWIRWDDEANKPDWWYGRISLDGDFSPDELRAILHFAPPT